MLLISYIELTMCMYSNFHLLKTEDERRLIIALTFGNQVPCAVAGLISLYVTNYYHKEWNKFTRMLLLISFIAPIFSCMEAVEQIFRRWGEWQRSCIARPAGDADSAATSNFVNLEPVRTGQPFSTPRLSASLAAQGYRNACTLRRLCTAA